MGDLGKLIWLKSENFFFFHCFPLLMSAAMVDWVWLTHRTVQTGFTVGGGRRAKADFIVLGQSPVPVLQQKGKVSQKTGKEHSGLYYR